MAQTDNQNSLLPEGNGISDGSGMKRRGRPKSLRRSVPFEVRMPQEVSDALREVSRRQFPGGRPKVIGDVQELARQKSPEAITTLANIMHDEKAPSAARVAAANALLDRGYGKPTQPISQTLAKIDPSSISDEELAAIAINGAFVNAQAH